MTYRILDYAHKNTVEAMQEYINLGILCDFKRDDVEWILRNCSDKVVYLFVRTYASKSCIVSVLDGIHSNIAERCLGTLEMTYDCAIQLTSEELRLVGKVYPENDKTALHYIKVGCGDLIFNTYITANGDILDHMEDVDYGELIINLTDNEDEEWKYIVERIIIENKDVKLPSDIGLLREVVKHVNSEDIWNMFRCSDNYDLPNIEFLDVLYENGVHNIPWIDYYMVHNSYWTIRHLHYFRVDVVLERYIIHGDIPYKYVKELDYANIEIKDGYIALTVSMFERITKLEKPIIYNYRINEYSLQWYSDNLLSKLSILSNVTIAKQDVSVVTAIKLLHYIPGVNINITNSSNDHDIREACKLYKHGYSTLCKRYPNNNTVKYIMELMNVRRVYSNTISDVTIIFQ